VMELEMAQILCASPDPNDPFDGNTGEPEEI